jgi:predicted transposase/invertase (TIGR01784 family)
MYDNTCRFLAENFPADFASWLLGEPTSLTELKPSELLLEPIRADALILLQSDALILHLEFQTRPKPNIPFRMLDYRVRCYRRYPDKTMRQVVLYLKFTESELVGQTHFNLERTHHKFDVIRLWEQPPEIFLPYPGLLPFATLAQTADSRGTLQQVAEQLEQIPDPVSQANLSAASAILAGLKLEEEVIHRILRKEIMQESTVYRSIQAEATTKRNEEIAINALRRGLSVELTADLTGLSIEAVQQLQGRS